MREKAYTIYNTPEYDEWLDEESAKSQVQVRSRIANIWEELEWNWKKALAFDKAIQGKNC